LGIVLKVLINAAALYVAVLVLDGIEFDGTVPALLLIALVMGVVNAVVQPILRVLSLPLILLTLGLFLIVINAIVLSIVIAISGALDLGLSTQGFGWTLAAAVIVSLVAWGLETLTGTR
jgi:putative membrane protein